MAGQICCHPYKPLLQPSAKAARLTLSSALPSPHRPGALITAKGFGQTKRLLFSFRLRVFVTESSRSGEEIAGWGFKDTLNRTRKSERKKIIQVQNKPLSAANPESFVFSSPTPSPFFQPPTSDGRRTFSSSTQSRCCRKAVVPTQYILSTCLTLHWPDGPLTGGPALSRCLPCHNI